MRRLLFALALLAGCGCAEAQTVPGALPSLGDGVRDTVRTMQYTPYGNKFISENGHHRFTRALYGGYTDYRIETSDWPIFAVVKKGHPVSVRFEIEGVPLDKAEYCKSWYEDGVRSYVLGDPRWNHLGDGIVRVHVVALQDREGAIWQFIADKYRGSLKVKVKVCDVAYPKLKRNGDIGVDRPDAFEPSPTEEGLVVGEATHSSNFAHLVMLDDHIQFMYDGDAFQLFQDAVNYNKELAQQVKFDTPDPFINPVAGAMMLAANGDWDGKTWLHGCVGWRMPLAGWRAAYMGDVLGWGDRAKSHFDAYAKSQVTGVEPTIAHPSQDASMNMARAEKQWGTQMYSNGYICRNPERNDQMHHYDMNLNYIDELLWHFQYDADRDYMRKMWPVIKAHLAWEKRNYDPDGDHLYDAYCCIWASDALYYNGGAVTHSSAYNYRSNLLTARIAEIIGEDPTPYREEAEAILQAMNERLWLDDLGYWAEFQDYMGLKRLHDSAAVWTIYTPIDCDACTPEQAWQATEYVDRSIPRIPVRYTYDEQAVRELGLSLPAPDPDLYTISTTDWLPYVWSTNNVAHEEVANMALAYLQAGRSDVGFRLLKADLLDEMYLGNCPGNFGQISYYDKSRSEAYRDFADNVGITARAIVCGLFGIIPDALNGRCILKPAFPEEWNEVSIRTPYLSYSFRREGSKDIYEIEQHFTRPLQIVVRANAGGGAYLEVAGDSSGKQTITVDRTKLPKPIVHKKIRAPKADVSSRRYLRRMGLDDFPARAMRKARMVDLTEHFNANVDDIYRNEYLSPRPPFTTLELPKQGVGEWCIPHEMHEIEDDGLRAALQDGVFDTGVGVRFRSPEQGPNIIYTSLWDNYPDSVTIPLEGRARWAGLLMAGSTNNMQSRIENGRVTVTYADGSKDVLPLENPINWCPIEQDYYTDDYAFWTAPKKPYRVLLSSGQVSRDLTVDFLPAAENDNLYDAVKETDRGIPDGAAQILRMPLRRKKLQSITLETLSNDVVIGLMAITLEK